MFFRRPDRWVAASLALACFVCTPLAAQAGGKRPVVVELYTSQGCAACPPADALVAQMVATRKDVIAMSMPITYWDMLGWRDTLGSDACTRRQKAYAQTMGHGGVYTPQMIVDGVSDVVGSKDAQVAAAISARESDEQSVPVTLSINKQLVHVSVGADLAHGDDNATIWLFRVMPQAKVAVGGGENSGHTLNYKNIVRDVRAVGVWKGQPVALDLPRDDLLGKSADSIAVVVQQSGYGRILGAAMLERPDYAAAR